MCNRQSHFFSLELLQNDTKTKNIDARFLAIDFNQWEPHVRSTLAILSFLAQSGFKCFYDQARFGFFPEFGKPYFGNQVYVKPYSLVEKQISVPEKSSDTLTLDLIDSELSSLMKASLVNVRDRRGLAKLRNNDFEYGYALVSTLASTFGRSELNSRLIRRYATSLLEDYIQTANNVYRTLITNRITHLIVFNGRFVKESAAVSAAKAANVTIVYHESSKSGRFFISCFSPLCSRGYFELTQFLTQERKSAEISKIAQTWFKNRITGQDMDISGFQRKWVPLTGSPVKSDLERKQIVIFTTSDDEFLGVSPEWDLPESQSQIEWLTRISQLAISYNHKVIIRLHPNLKTKSKSLQKEWSKLSKVKNLKLIGYNDSVNSYSLINESDLIISCGSTIAMEAGFLGKPVLSVGSGIYDGLQAVKKSQDLEYIEKLFRDENFESVKPIKSKIEIYGFTEMSKFDSAESNLLMARLVWDFDLFKPSLLVRLFSKLYREIVFKLSLINR